MSSRPTGSALAPPGWRRVWPVALVGVLVAALIVGARVGLPGEPDVTAPFVVGTEWGLGEALVARDIDVTLRPDAGYDGQWFLGHAYDPLVRGDIVTAFDRPQYRSLRPMFPVAGWLLAAGQPGLIPLGLLVVSVLMVGLGCAACARITAAHQRSRWWGLLFVAVPGVVVGLQFATAEPMGLALAALGLCLMLDRRYGWAGLAFAGAALTKETYVAFAVMAAGFLAVEARFRGWAWLARAAAVSVPGVVALGAWWMYVSAVVPASQRTPNHLLDLPFMGWLRLLQQVAQEGYPAPHQLAGPVVLTATFGLLLAALVVAVLVVAVWRRRSVLAYQVALWSVFGLSLVHIMLERYLSAQRVLAPAVLMAALLLVTAWPFGPRRVEPVESAEPVEPTSEPAAAPG